METNHANFSDPAKRTPFYSALLYEFLGTAIVTAAFNLSTKVAMVRAGAYLGVYLFAGGVSGGHFNPATTLAVYLSEKEHKESNKRYMISAIVV